MQLRLPTLQPLTVDELTFHIQGLFSSDAMLRSVVVSGEIAEFKKHTSGHCYFTLLGEESRVACAFFKQYAGYVPKWPDNGDSVLVEGSVGLYPQRGVYQFYARRIVPQGEGAIERARLEVKERLEKEGVFAPELKRSLPDLPSRVALVTSGTGAAVWDVLHVAGRRCPSCSILVIPTQVQGIEAPQEIVRALEQVAFVPGLDCVLLVRGGGSREDLVSFDDERVVRAVRSCPVPVVSGVGHDVDTTLCDLAADVHAATPSAAAELVFPDSAELLQELSGIRNRLMYAFRGEIDMQKNNLEYMESNMLARVGRHVATWKIENESRSGRLEALIRLSLAAAREKLAISAASLDALSPLAVMMRGFVICERQGERVVSAKNIASGEMVNIRFVDGAVRARVDEVLPDDTLQ